MKPPSPHRHRRITHRVMAVVGGLLWSAAAPGRATEDWPQFRGPDRDGVAPAAALPVEWNATRNLAWKAALPGPGSSSPVTFGERVYVTCYSGYGLNPGEAGDSAALRRHLLCVSRDDGRILWQKTVPPKAPENPFVGGVSHHGFASSTPAVDEAGVYVFFGASGVAAYSHAGGLRWEVSCGTNVFDYGSAASPALTADLLILNAGVEARKGNSFRDKGALLALDRRTGRERWRFTDMFNGYTSPVIVRVDGSLQVVLGKRGGMVSGHSVADGTEIWRCAAPVYAPTPVVHDGVLYLLAKNGFAALRTSGRGEVTDTHKLWEVKRSAYRISSPVFRQGHLYWAQGGIAHCANAATGALVYQERLGTARNVYASPVLAGDRIYYVTQRKGTFVVPARPEFAILAHNVIESDPSVFNGSPAVSQGRIFLRSNQYLYCLTRTR